jgi:hypothetical protein
VKKTKILTGSLTIVMLFTCIYTFAQQPFEEYGYKVNIGTLSQGKYNEFFDQDTLVQIGSVVLNSNTGQLVYFVTYDTTYSEATLQPEVVSRWISPDPLAQERYEYSPYNFVRNNPIIFTDPTGALDEYYGIVNGTLTHLGSDGQGNNIRLVAEDRHEEAVQNLNGANTTQEQVNTLRNGEMSQVVTFNEGQVTAEVQGAHDRTRGSGLENSALITLDPATATVGAQPGAQGTNTGVTNTLTGYGGDGQWASPTQLVVGIAHGHPVLAANPQGMVNGPGYSEGDAREAANNGMPAYAIDSYATRVGGAATVHEVVPGTTAGQNSVGTTQSVNNLGRSSFLAIARPYQR